MSQVTKLSQMTAILLERAMKQGVPGDAILAGMDANDTSVFKKAEATHYSYDEFFTYAKEHGENLQSAIEEGYQMKYNTQGGLRTWLETRFGLLHEMDYNFEMGRLTKIPLSKADARYLCDILAVNWVMLVSADGENYKLAAEFFKDDTTEADKVFVNLIFLSEYQKDIANK